jgi:hypothetical protein
MFTNAISPVVVGLVLRTVVSISHCGCDDPGLIPRLDSVFVSGELNLIVVFFCDICTLCKRKESVAWKGYSISMVHRQVLKPADGEVSLTVGY